MQQQIEDFWQNLRRFYDDFGRRDMPWRLPEPDGSFDPYKILVSELMLQQTQVPRVTSKFTEFIARFPTVQPLAKAPLSDVLQIWSGLGYNRRAKFLWQAAKMIVDDCDGAFPRTLAGLQRLPGVGPNTAGAIMAYAFNQPVVYVETNIRTVIIHHFFKDEIGVSDAAIREVLERALQGRPPLEPREFYWAMMDYGAYLKQTVGNLNRGSKSYAKQSAFHGSRRQLRGLVLRLLTERPYSISELVPALADDRARGVIMDLLSEHLIQQDGDMIRLGRGMEG